MELELKQAYLNAYETGGEWTLTQEESVETIVPDSCPDMARIISTQGTVFVHSREVRDGKAEVTGTVRVTVLYMPDQEGGVRALNFAVPFTLESDSSAMPGCRVLTAETGLEFLESRMLNPRKIFTHCRLAARLTGYQQTQHAYCTDVEAGEDLGVEKQQERQRTILLTEVSEKDFTFSEELNLSPGRIGAAELLHNEVRTSVTETKLVGSKLIFKGVFHVSLLYRTPEGICASASSEMPFSQIMEAESGSESSTATLQLQLTGADLQISHEDPEGRRIAVTLYLHATALLRCQQELTLLSDLYSTSYETHYEASPLTLTAFHEGFLRRQTVREVLEIGTAAETILSAAVTCGAVSVSREGEYVTLRTAAAVRVLYLDEGGVALMAERTLEVSCQTELPEGCHVTARAFCPDEVQGSLGDRGIEVRFPVDFQIEAAKRVKRVCISAAKLSPESDTEAGEMPSLVLRCLSGRETAWDLAKRYHTTISAILSANKLENETELPRDRLLLIPRKRA